MIDSKELTTFIMAGGKGERLYPLTIHRAKPAVPFAGIYRIIDFTLSNCINSGIRRIHVLTQYKSRSLERHVIQGWNIFEPELGEYIDIMPAQQRTGDHWYLGTADSVYQNIDLVDLEQSKYVLILAGDHIYKMNYAKMLNVSLEKNADVVVGLVEIEKDRSLPFGTCELDSDMRISGFKEKSPDPHTIPGRDQFCYISMGIYSFRTEVLKEVLKKNYESEKTDHDFGKNILPMMVKSGYKVYGYTFKDENTGFIRYWRDVGDVSAYYECNIELAGVSPLFNLYDRKWPIRTYKGQYPPVKTVFADEKRRGHALDSLISDGCILSGGFVNHSVLSPNVRVNSFAEVHDSILFENVNIGRNAKIKKAILDKNVEVRENIEIGYDLKKDKERFFTTPDGIVVIPRDTVVDA